MTMHDILRGKMAAVTGGSGGIGRAVCDLFARQGAMVCVMDVDDGQAQEVASQLPGHTHKARRVDVSDAAGVRGVFSELGPLDILVNCAGVREIRDPLALDESEWERVVGINLAGTFYCSQAAARKMVARRSGSIVNISSVAALRGFRSRAAYSASKAGVIGLTRSLSGDFARHGVRVNTVVPGLIQTPLTAAYVSDSSFAENLGNMIPLGAPGKPDDVAFAALYLASEMSSYVTGTELVVDGGFIGYGTYETSVGRSAFTADAGAHAP